MSLRPLHSTTGSVNSLANIDLSVSYRSDQGNIVDLFYVPCLEEATLYQRAVGFFTSSGLAAAAKGLASMTKVTNVDPLVESLTDIDDDVCATAKEALEKIIRKALEPKK